MLLSNFIDTYTVEISLLYTYVLVVDFPNNGNVMYAQVPTVVTRTSTSTSTCSCPCTNFKTKIAVGPKIYQFIQMTITLLEA